MFFITFTVALLVGCHGSLRYASYYQDHMVLQRGPKQAVMWGHATKIGDTVQVTIAGQGSATTTVMSHNAGQGVWKVKLPAVTDKGPFTVTATSSEGSVSIKDVLFGDVWICSGQSNMEFTTAQVFNHTEEILTSLNYSDIRILRLSKVQFTTRQDDLNSHGIATNWTPPTQCTDAFFGEYLYPDLNYPIGLVETSWGGTPIEVWSSPDALAACSHAFFNQTYGPNGHSVLWNSMVYPLLGMTIRGVIWYQGEANSRYNHSSYACMFEAMIKDWRKKFHQGSQGQTSADFPFGFVQLGTVGATTTTVGAFPSVRWAQTANIGTVPNSKLPNTFMATAMDLPDFNSPFYRIHPRDKQDVARRLVLGARAVAYNETDVKFQGPLPKRVFNDQARHKLKIFYQYGPIVVRNIHGFEVCCSQRTKCGSNDRWTTANIISHHLQDIVLSTSGCGKDNVVGMRYAWRESPCRFKQCAIYGSDTSLPAPPYIHTSGFVSRPIIIGK